MSGNLCSQGHLIVTLALCIRQFTWSSFELSSFSISGVQHFELTSVIF